MLPAVGGHGAGRAHPAQRGLADVSAQLLAGVHISPLIQACYSHAQPQSHRIASKATPWPPGEGKKTLAFPATVKIALTIEKHLIFQETDRERMLVSLSS